MKRAYIIILMAGMFFGILNAEVTVLSQSTNKIVLNADFSETRIDHNKYTFVTLPGFTDNVHEGFPAIPYKEVRIAVPPMGEISVNIVSEKFHTQKIESRIRPVQTITEAGETYEFLDIINENEYKKKQTDIFVVSELQRFRFQEYYTIKIFPVLYDDSNLELSVYDELVLEVEIIGNTSYRNVIIEKVEDIYAEFLINYEYAQNWKSKKSNLPQHINFAASDYWYKFNTERGGIYTLSYKELRELPTFCNPKSIRLYTMLKQDESVNDFKYAVEEISLFIDSDDEINENTKITFPLFGTGLSDKQNLWLTFGGDFDSEPKRLEQIHLNREVEEVMNFEKYFPKNILNSRQQADCLIIHPEEFVVQANELATFHAENYNVVSEVWDQQGIFDNWTAGEPDPEAIKMHIEHILNDYDEPPIEYVILLGSGTNEWDNNTEKNKIITYNGLDDNFVTFDGNFPDLSISRFPAQNTSDMDFLLERLIKYVEEPSVGWWRNKILLVADDENKDGGLEGYNNSNETNTMNHTKFAQETQELINRSVLVDKVLGIEYDFDEYQNKPDARNEMIRRVNEGRLVWYYVGHGNEDVMGDEDYFRGSHHLPLLDNEADGARPARLPLHISASCSVGMFDEVGFDSLGEKLVLLRTGGAISVIAASRACYGTSNTQLIKRYFIESINDKESVGRSLWSAKLYSGASIYNSKKFILFGDPVMNITTPEITGFTDISEPVDVDSLQSGQLVKLDIDYEIDYPSYPVTDLRVIGSDIPMHYEHTIGNDTYSVDYTRNGGVLYNGSSVVPAVNHPAYVVPLDVRTGSTGRIINYLKDNITKQDYICFEDDIKYSPIALDIQNNDVPLIDIFLGSEDFKSGDYVSSSPNLIIDLSDENGLNTTGSSGHDIMYILDNAEPVPVTEYFVYDFGDYKSGQVNHKLENLTEGLHTIKVIAFDSFNAVSVAETEFQTKSSGEVSIEKMLPYPNPMQDEGCFTFIITEDSDVVLDIYTISGRKIRTLKAGYLSSGFNKVKWNCKDQDGDSIANGTYFYKIKANKTDKTGKVIILK